ncbi:MAG: methionine--tRNA ligase [Nanoarchaeota archaeon]|nr:methionine--tRNA ligase [Nanoarchaeota archaeon]|tara:strand:- start:286 stop:2322 length:2037 start_codon:yes stop_codon:yes gene_type:complete
MRNRTVITAALPYVNGSPHLGHMVEYVQGDIYSRFLKSQGEDVLYICASDSHGTPIEINARKQGITPLQLVKKYEKEFIRDFKSFLVEFDNYYTTHSKENQELAELFFSTLQKKKLIYTKNIEVIYCNHCQRNLPDRLVKGQCPNCSTADQYGDVCESCGLVLKGTDLINPKCAECGNSPVKKESLAYFFALSKFTSKLKTFLKGKWVQPEVRNSVSGWINDGLEDWCISRDGPYFGFKIPGEENKYFYVWLDAPIGYISSTKNLLDKKGKKWESYWKDGKVVHFIGKDIIYFHYLFWPALLMAMDIKLPELNTHGFLTINGQKMSKSRGTFITAKKFSDDYNPEYLRFYYALRLSKKLVDIDLDLKDFQAVINNKLLANLGNFCYRTLSFIDKNYSGKIGKSANDKIIKKIKDEVKEIEKNYHDLNYKEAMNGILRISDLGNAYFQHNEPWKDKLGKQDVVFLCANIVRNLSILIKPVLPVFSENLEMQLGCKNLSWKDISFDYSGKIKKPSVLINRIEDIEQPTFPLDLRVGEIIKVSDHPNADKLFVLKVNFGSEQRQIVAGLKKFWKSSEIVGKKCVFVFNIKPAKLRGVESNGMILVASDGKHASLLEVAKSKPGSKAGFEGLSANSGKITFDDFLRVSLQSFNGEIKYDSKILKTELENVSVKHVNDGAVVS